MYFFSFRRWALGHSFFELYRLDYFNVRWCFRFCFQLEKTPADFSCASPRYPSSECLRRGTLTLYSSTRPSMAKKKMFATRVSHSIPLIVYHTIAKTALIIVGDRSWISSIIRVLFQAGAVMALSQSSLFSVAFLPVLNLRRRLFSVGSIVRAFRSSVFLCVGGVICVVCSVPP